MEAKQSSSRRYHFPELVPIAYLWAKILVRLKREVWLLIGKH